MSRSTRIIGWVYIIAGTIPALIGFAIGWVISPLACGIALGIEMGRDFSNEVATRWRHDRS